MNCTISKAPITCVEITGGEPTWLIAHCVNRIAAPLQLVNGKYLYIENILVLRRPEKYPATLSYRYQYQGTQDPDSWVFRYEYDREPVLGYPYPRSHVHVNASPLAYDGKKVFADLHLPVPERVTIEDVIRHLIVEHDLKAISRKWEKKLTETRTHFEEIQKLRQK